MPCSDLSPWNGNIVRHRLTLNATFNVVMIAMPTTLAYDTACKHWIYVA